MATMPTGYRIENSGDELAPLEVIAPDGRTVTLTETRADAVEIARADVRERETALT